MANDLVTIVCLSSALFVLIRVVSAASVFNVKAWNGHRWRLVGLASFWAFAGAGAVAVAAGAPIGGPLLLLAVTLLLASDRRVR